MLKLKCLFFMFLLVVGCKGLDVERDKEPEWLVTHNGSLIRISEISFIEKTNAGTSIFATTKSGKSILIYDLGRNLETLEGCVEYLERITEGLNTLDGYSTGRRIAGRIGERMTYNPFYKEP